MEPDVFLLRFENEQVGFGMFLVIWSNKRYHIIVLVYVTGYVEMQTLSQL